MEPYEAAGAVFSRVQSIDPQNASKIIGYILLHHGEKDMIRFAYGPETLIVSIINRAKTELGLSSNTSSASAVSPLSNPISISRTNPLSLSLPSPRLPTNGFNPSSPSSPSIWSPHHSLSPNANATHSLTNGSLSSATVGFGGVSNNSRENFVDEYHLQDQSLSFLNDPLAIPSKNGNFFEQGMDLSMSPGCRSDSMLNPYCWDNSDGGGVESNPHIHRRSSSFNDVYYGTDDSTSGFGFKPCLYYAKGFCKNGSTCKFVHGAGFPDSPDNSSPKFDPFEQCQEEMLRSKFAQQQRLAAQLMASGVNLPYNKLKFLRTEAQRSAAAALMMGEEFHKLNRVRMSRNEFSGMGLRGDSNPGSRQIYLTFPADSTFKEEDVSQYFSNFGPVQDVRIPYQQKRMFGFVTFVYPETVNMILAKGNPHFVCDSRVLVKPYKEKGKIPYKKQQQLERGDFSCSSPSGHDSREPFDFQLGGRMFYNTQEMLLKKKLEEQADLQQALELQGRRLMNLQLMDLKNHQYHQQNVGSPVLSPNLSQLTSNLSAPNLSNGTSEDISEGSDESSTGAPDLQLSEGDKAAPCAEGNGNLQNKESKSVNDEFELPESLEHILPDSLFASPKKVSERRSSLFSSAFAELNDGATITSSSVANGDSSMPAASPLIAPHKSCFFEMPRLSSGQRALGM